MKQNRSKTKTVVRVIAFLLVAARGLHELSAGRVGRTGDHVPLHAA